MRPCGSRRSLAAWPSRPASSREIEYTGLRPGEKLHEVLLGADEVDVRPHHELISQVPVPPLRFEDARTACSVDGRLVLSAATLELAATTGLGGDAGRRGCAVGQDDAR